MCVHWQRRCGEARPAGEAAVQQLYGSQSVQHSPYSGLHNPLYRSQSVRRIIQSDYTIRCTDHSPYSQCRTVALATAREGAGWGRGRLRCHQGRHDPFLATATKYNIWWWAAPEVPPPPGETWGRSGPARRASNPPRAPAAARPAGCPSAPCWLPTPDARPARRPSGGRVRTTVRTADYTILVAVA